MTLDHDGCRLTYVRRDGALPVPDVLKRLNAAGIAFRTIETRRARLEDIFVDLIGARA